MGPALRFGAVLILGASIATSIKSVSGFLPLDGRADPKKSARSVSYAIGFQGVTKNNVNREINGRPKEVLSDETFHRSDGISLETATNLGWDIGLATGTSSRGYANQDNFLIRLYSQINDEGHVVPTVGLFAIMDGHGHAGHLSSQAAVEVTRRLSDNFFGNYSRFQLNFESQTFRDHHTPLRERPVLLSAAIRYIYDRVERELAKRGVQGGTTFTLILWDVDQEKLFTASAGDSLAYRGHNETLELISADHGSDNTEVNKLLRESIQNYFVGIKPEKRTDFHTSIVVTWRDGEEEEEEEEGESTPPYEEEAEKELSRQVHEESATETPSAHTSQPIAATTSLGVQRPSVPADGRPGSAIEAATPRTAPSSRTSTVASEASENNFGSLAGSTASAAISPLRDGYAPKKAKITEHATIAGNTKKKTAEAKVPGTTATPDGTEILLTSTTTTTKATSVSTLGAMTNTSAEPSTASEGSVMSRPPNVTRSSIGSPATVVTAQSAPTAKFTAGTLPDVAPFRHSLLSLGEESLTQPPNAAHMSNGMLPLPSVYGKLVPPRVLPGSAALRYQLYEPETGSIDFRLGSLQPARSMGDGGQGPLITSESFVRSDPEIKVYDLKRDPFDFVLMTSDGFTNPFRFHNGEQIYQERVVKCNPIERDDCLEDPSARFMEWSSSTETFYKPFDDAHEMFSQAVETRSTHMMYKLIERHIANASTSNEAVKSALEEMRLSLGPFQDDVTLLYVKRRQLQAFPKAKLVRAHSPLAAPHAVLGDQALASTPLHFGIAKSNTIAAFNFLILFSTFFI